MNKQIMHSDSLLSNISNITVRIDHNHMDGSGFFKNFAHNNEEEQEVPIDALDDQQSFNHNSLLDKINCRMKQHAQTNQPQNTWVTGNNGKGVSQQEVDESESLSQEPVENLKGLKSQVSIQQQMLDQEQQSRKKILLEKRLKNQTKNIPKNYGKAIISFIQKYEEKVKYITTKYGVNYQDFINELKQKKKTINTIADLRNMWIDYKYAQCMRLLSNLFLRKYALNYIFNSRICNYGSHIKYRYRLCQAIKEPFAFKHIKDY